MTREAEGGSDGTGFECDCGARLRLGRKDSERPRAMQTKMEMRASADKDGGREEGGMRARVEQVRGKVKGGG